MTSQSARDSNRAHLRVERYFVEELGWSSVGANRVQSLDDPIGTEPNRIGGVYVDENDGHYAVLVQPVSAPSRAGDRAYPGVIGTDTWFASRLDIDAGVHAPHMRQAGYWRLAAQVDSGDRIALRALNTDGTMGPQWIPPLDVADGEVTTTSPMLTMTRRESAAAPRWWQRVPVGAWIAGVITISVIVLSGLWLSGQGANEPSAVVMADPTSTPQTTATPVATPRSIDLADVDDPAGGSAPAGAAAKIEVPTTTASPDIAATPTAEPAGGGSQPVSTPAPSTPAPTAAAAVATEAPAVADPTAAPTAPPAPTAVPTQPPATPEPTPTQGEGGTCQGDGYSVSVPSGWSQAGCATFDPGSAVTDCSCQHHIDVATATAETFDEAVARITASSDYTVASQTATTVNGRAAHKFELVAHTQRGDIGQLVVVINAPRNVVYAAASQQADAGTPGTWSDTLAAFESIIGSLAFA